MWWHSFPRFRRAQGFTLLELLIALSVFSLVSVMAYTGLNTVLNAEHETRWQAAQLKRLQMGFSLLGRDVSQAVARPVRDEFGQALPAFQYQLNRLGQSSLELTHTGHRNPGLLPRSHLRRVAYLLDDEERLVRKTWTTLDRADDAQPYEQVMLEGVKRLELRFLDQAREWQSSWPPQSNDVENPNLTLLPLAVEIRLVSDIWGEIRRVYRMVGT